MSHYYCDNCQNYFGSCICGLKSKEKKESVKQNIDPKIQQKINESEKLKKLVQKYPDLRYDQNDNLITDLANHKCNKFKLKKQCEWTYLKLYFIEEGFDIYIKSPFSLSPYNRKSLIQYLKQLNISSDLILQILEEHDR